jgi:hypothetical protein
MAKESIKENNQFKINNYLGLFIIVILTVIVSIFIAIIKPDIDMTFIIIFDFLIIGIEIMGYNIFLYHSKNVDYELMIGIGLLVSLLGAIILCLNILFKVINSFEFSFKNIMVFPATGIVILLFILITISTIKESIQKRKS